VINVDNSIFHADSILISNAMMNVANGSSLAGSLVVENNGALNVSGGATHTGNVTLEDGSMFSVDSGLLTIDGTLTFNQDFTFNYSEGGQFEVDSLAFGVDNTVTWNFDASPIYSDWLFRSQNDIFGGLIGNQVLATNLAGPYYLASTFSGGYYYIAVIPEPSTYALMILGAVVMIVAVRRARKKQAASF
ncbi:PEP-CTERM sorting domain-containing protein, partial [Oscillatoria laete-virens NRMC-F 0139]